LREREGLVGGLIDWVGGWFVVFVCRAREVVCYRVLLQCSTAAALLWRAVSQGSSS
jgi:hypothetical protein